MKKLLLMTMAVAMTFGAATAQDKDKRNLTPNEKAAKHTAKMTEVAGLTPDQQVKVKAIALEREMQREANRKEFAGNKEAGKQKAQAQRRASDERLKQVLTPEQYQKVMDNRQHSKEKHKAKHEEHGTKVKTKTKTKPEGADEDDDDEL